VELPVEICPTRPFSDQRPGTSGLRKKVKVFQQPNYLENFIQSLFDLLPEKEGKTLVLGGDGRYGNPEALQTIVKMAVANRFGKLIVGQHGWLSTPAASHLIRKRRAAGGILLTASHNPGGPEGDFGVKFNVENGGPAPPKLTEAVYRRSLEIDRYRIARIGDIDLDRRGSLQVGGTEIEIVDPVDDYAALMTTLFDFDLMRDRFRKGELSILFDAMHAITGPYAHRILVDMLGAPEESLLHPEPLPDFGGLHPDPNLTYARELVERMAQDDAPLLGAASDGDGDRNMILGRRFFVTPSDSLAVIAANASKIPGYRRGLSGVARSMPTSRALDGVAAAIGVPCYETPTGWKFFVNLLEAGRVTICGEESFGTGSDHVREKDGLWAVLFWLNLLAATGKGVSEMVRDHWRRFGRHYYSRHDYEALDSSLANRLFEDLRAMLPQLEGKRFDAFEIERADEFGYTDPIDGSRVERQGIRIFLRPEGRIVFRISGTGTEGATIRIYFERFEPDPSRHDLPVQEALAPLIEIAEAVSELRRRSHREGPTVVT